MRKFSDFILSLFALFVAWTIPAHGQDYNTSSQEQREQNSWQSFSDFEQGDTPSSFSYKRPSPKNEAKNDAKNDAKTGKSSGYNSQKIPQLSQSNALGQTKVGSFLLPSGISNVWNRPAEIPVPRIGESPVAFSTGFALPNNYASGLGYGYGYPSSFRSGLAVAPGLGYGFGYGPGLAMSPGFGYGSGIVPGLTSWRSGPSWGIYNAMAYGMNYPGFGGISPFASVLPGFGGYGGMGYSPFWGGFSPAAGALSAGISGGSARSEIGRLSTYRFVQTAPSKSSGNYYQPSTVDPTASGSYYASQGPSLQPIIESSPQPTDYWGPAGNPFKDLENKAKD